MSGRRFDVATLDAVLAARLGPPVEGGDPLAGYSAANCAAILGISERNWTRYRSVGHLSELLADRFAGRLQLHPVDIWPDWYGTSIDIYAAEMAGVA